MKCPGCGTSFASERQLSVTPSPTGTRVPWYRPAPRRRLACPECGIALRHNRVTLCAGVGLGAVYLGVLGLKTLHPHSEAIALLFTVVSLGLIPALLLLMRRRSYFKRAET